MNILGIATIQGESAAALLRNGQLVAALEEAKISRRSKRGELPREAIEAALRIAGISPADIDIVAVARPVPSNAASTLNVTIRELFPSSRMVLVGHHLAHAASAFFASPFDEATVLTLDRGGDLRCGARWKGSPAGLDIESEFYYPDSLADLFTRVTELLGFSPDADEHKTQWLAAAGDRSHVDLFNEMIGNGDMPRLDRSYFDPGRLTRGGFSTKFFDALGLDPESAVNERDRANIASGVQHAIEKAVQKISAGATNLCIAGGLGFNAFLITALEDSGLFQNVFAQPVSGNAGTALGAVLHVWHDVLGKKQRVNTRAYLLGPEFSAEETKQVLENCKLSFRYLLTGDELVETAVAELSEQKIVAWMQGRMEFGPRALGNRSILASPLDPYSTENLNIFIKRRESFRKFAASVPEELAAEYFITGPNARALASVSRVKPAHRKTFESALLGEDWIRVHTVRREDNPLYWNLLHAAGRKTGLPVLYNTSFNLFGEPLVCSPRDAVRSFYASGIDALFCGHFFLQK
jgi:carbamoyltransferase